MEAGPVFPERVVHSQSIRQRLQETPAALANGHRVPCGHEQNTPTMPDHSRMDQGAVRQPGAQKLSVPSAASSGRPRPYPL